MPLVALAAAFLLLFAWQRSRSDFLAIEARRPAAERLAEQHGLTVADVLALHDFVGSAASAEVWQEAVRSMASWGMASWSGASPGQDVLAALAASGTDALGVRRFRLLRERFAARR